MLEWIKKNERITWIATVILSVLFLVDLVTRFWVVHLLLMPGFMFPYFFLLYLQAKSVAQIFLRACYVMIVMGFWIILPVPITELVEFRFAIFGFAFLLFLTWAIVRALEELPSVLLNVSSERKGKDDGTDKGDLPQTKDQKGKYGGYPLDPAGERMQSFEYRDYVETITPTRLEKTQSGEATTAMETERTQSGALADRLSAKNQEHSKIRDEIMRLWREGKTDVQIGKYVSLSPTRVKQIRRELGLIEREKKSTH